MTVTAPFLYEQVVQELGYLIVHHTLQPGERLPSLRELSRNRKISMATAMQAYSILEAQGLLQVRPQSGYYVSAYPQRISLPEPESHPASPIVSAVSIDHLIEQVLDNARQPDILPLGIATIAPDWLPIRKLGSLLAPLSREPEAHRYAATAGYPELRRQIALRSVDSGNPLKPEEVVLTCGGMEALSLALRTVAQAGDTIAVESPTYYGILQTIEGLGMKALALPTHPREGLVLSEVEKALQTHPLKAGIFIPTFHNPLGSCMPSENKARLVELFTSRGIPIIEDDIYGEFYFSDPPPPTLRSFDRTGLVILCSSFSKTLSPGLRVGWAIPGQFYNTFLRLKRMSTLVTATLPQMAVADFLERGWYERHLRQLRRRLQVQSERFSHAIATYFPAGTRLSRPQGGFVLWVELPPTVDAFKLYQKALQHRISLAPGSMFAVDGEYLHCIRLSFGMPWSDTLDKGLFLLGALAKEMT